MGSNQISGTLYVDGGSGNPKFSVDLNEKRVVDVPRAAISKTILDNPTAFDRATVEVERHHGKITRVWEKGGAYVSAKAPFMPDKQESRKGTPSVAPTQKVDKRPNDKSQTHGGSPGQTHYFHNPYNFVCAPPRKISNTNLGDGPPIPWNTFDLTRYTGTIRVELTAVSPLLVFDPTKEKQENIDGKSHITCSVRMNGDLPAIPASSVRGMVRSAYETITHSRFGRFRGDGPPYTGSESAKQDKDWPCRSCPEALKKSGLLPPKSVDELSPADRVFGWVWGDAGEVKPKDGRIAARSLVRIGSVRCNSEPKDAVQVFSSSVPIAILASPKPQQARFYVANSPDGEAQSNGLKAADAAYKNGKGLRGRKVYPHQRLPLNHWNDPLQDRTQTKHNGHYQEYRRPQKDGKEQRDDQNRSITGWIKPHTIFEFDIQVTNLSKVELGALLWLLTLADGYYFRLGGGKPFGFGSVRLRKTSCDLRTGTQLTDKYRSWYSKPVAEDPTDVVVKAFKQAVVDAYGSTDKNQFEKISFIAAFLKACSGYDTNRPIHYPRATADGTHGPPHPDGESFRWFVANNKPGNQYALSDLVHDVGLPTLSEPIDRV